MCIEFDPRTGSEVRKQCYKWRGLSTPERAKFFKKHGTRWSELARLSYFDIVRCSIIDPMHNLLLGVVKTQWFSQWIQEKVLRKATATHGRELDFIHNFLATFETPLWMGKLPHRVGEPAGGSLTADEYKLAALVAFPLIIPIVWDNFGDAATAELASAQDLYERNLAKYEKERAQWLAEQVANAGGEPRAEPTPPKQPHLRMKYGEVHNFLRLSTSLKIFFSPVVDTSKLQRAQDLLQDYLLGFRTLYPDSDMKPNHHWSVHLKDQVHDYGPVYTFWTFLGERLNKTLKSFNSNGWTGGQVEISMMRYFGREAQLDALVKAVLKHINPLHASNDEKLCLDVGMRMFGLSPEACGTVQDSASSLRYTIVAEAGPVVQSAKLSSRICAALHSYYNGTGLIRVHHPLDSPSSNTVSFVLRDRADYINYVTYSGRRITPTSRSQRNSAGSSIVLAKLDGKQFAGELVSVFQHFQPGFRNTVLFAEMKWMRPFEEELPTDNVWLEFPELGVQFWEYNSYLTPDSIGSPPLVVPFSYIQGQLARGVIDCWDPPFWITTTLAQISMDLRTNYDNSSDQDSNDINSVTAL